MVSFSSISKWLPFSLLVFALAGCFKDRVSKTYSIARPIYKTRTAVLAEVSSAAPSTPRYAGKIFIKGNYLFLNEQRKGVHVFDNSDPSHPRAVSFITIPGNIDIGIKGNILYADLFEDLVALDISDPLHAKLISSINNLFKVYDFGLYAPDSNQSILVGWEVKDTTVDVDNASNGWACPNCVIDERGLFNSVSSPGVSGKSAAGSMAKFVIVNNYLYALSAFQLGVVDIANASHPEVKNGTPVGGGIETIYPFRNKLFIGSNSGLFIYNINNPMAPEMEGMFSHARACDPVVADDDYAFVTLRTGTACQGNSDQLDVLDVTNVTSPQLVRTYPMTNPHGLAKDGSLLFLCDGKDGLKIFDASDVNNLQLIKKFSGMDAYDVIAMDNILILSSDKGLMQYDYSDRNNIRLLSAIAINRR